MLVTTNIMTLLYTEKRKREEENEKKTSQILCDAFCMITPQKNGRYSVIRID